MELSSPRFKSLAITAGFSFWFFVISSATGLFSFELFGAFIAITLTITQIFAIINTKIFLGILFIFVVSIYGIIFRVLGIDLFRLKKQKLSYWIKIEKLKQSTLYKQY